jgi:magnesium-transporting ATPase (P-type)
VCIIGATGFVVMARLYNDQFGYLQYPSAVISGDMDSALGDWIIQFAYLMLLLGNFIPVSLYVSMSTIRFFQAIFMEWDLRMYHAPVDQHCEVGESSITQRDR